MAYDSTEGLLPEAIPNKHQEFYNWLTTVPLGVLYRMYKQHTAIKDTLSTPPDALSQNLLSSDKIVLRKSVFILVLTIINIEILFDGLYILLRLPPMYIHFPSPIQDQLPSVYFLLLAVINIGKIFLIIYTCIRWVTTIYEIKNGEIRFKKGIISVDQKIYLCRHTQEVFCKQGFIGKIFNFGSIEIYDPTLATNIRLDSIQNPCKYADIIRKSLFVYKTPELIPINPSVANI